MQVYLKCKVCSNARFAQIQIQCWFKLNVGSNTRLAKIQRWFKYKDCSNASLSQMQGLLKYKLSSNSNSMLVQIKV